MSLICFYTMYKWTLHSPFLFFSKLRFWPKIFRCCVLRWGRCPRHDQPSEQLRPTLFHFAPPPPATQLTRFTNNCNLFQPPYQPILVYAEFSDHFIFLPLIFLAPTWFNLTEPEKNKSSQGVFIPTSPFGWIITKRSYPPPPWHPSCPIYGWFLERRDEMNLIMNW